MPASRSSLSRRTARVAGIADGIERARGPTAEERRAELERLARMAGFIRQWAAPEDEGPALVRALAMGEDAIAALGYTPAAEDITAADLARLPAEPPPEFLSLWQKLGQVARNSDPDRPPRSVGALYARCVARSCGGRFPFYPGQE